GREAGPRRHRADDHRLGHARGVPREGGRVRGQRLHLPDPLSAPRRSAADARHVRSRGLSAAATTMIDRARLAELMVAEEEAFVAARPRSAALASEARTHLLGGVPMNWMARWPGAFPVFVAEASGARFVDVDGIEYVDLC